MKTPHTNAHTYLTDSDIEIWLEADLYPRLIIKRPKKIRSSYTVLSEQTREPFEQIIKNNEEIFIEDLIRNFVANPEITNEVKLNTAKLLKELVENMERKILEKIEIEQLDKEDFWRKRSF